MPFWRWLYFSSSDFECQELIKQRFWQRLWSVYIRWNQRDFHQFSWNPALFLWRYLHKWIYLVYTNSWLLVFNLEVMILQLYTPSKHCWHSLWQAPTPQRQKIPYYYFYCSKISSMTCDWSDVHFSLVRKPM